MQPFFDQLILNTSPFNFETTLKCGMPGSVSSPIDTTDAELGMVVPHLEAQPFESEDFHITSLSGISMFASQACQTLQERVHQTLHIIRNLSFMPENALAFSKDHRMLTLFAKAIALPADTIYVEIKQYALEIYENLASFIILRGQNDFYLTCLKQMLFENDRGRVVGSLRCMIRLTMTEANEKSIMGIETSIIQRLIQLLLIPDEEIISGVMEFLYLFSGLGSEIGVRIMQCVRFNVLRLFLKFLEWKGVGKVSTHVHGSSAPPIAANTSSIAAPGAALASRPTTPAMAVPFTPALQRPPAYLDPRAIDHFQAAIWLQGILEADATYAIHQVGLMNEYEAYCKMTNLKALQLPELIKLIQNIFVGSTSRDHASAPGVTIINGVIKGIRPRLNTTASTSTHLVNVMSHLHHIFPEANDELRGIPLSAVLVLRNIARHPDNREFFSPFEGDLAQLMLLPRFNKVVGTILAELKG
ncbi:hypothetical protein QVD99_001001 [Batrachochytrium dendrobatidis]|nr:hypothetical protein QVD99_001001 [Batrachochytrium dendrobatidis]